MMDADRRRALQEAKRRVKELLRPEVEARKIAKAKHRQKVRKALTGGDGQRAPRVKDAAYLNFIRRLPCTICGKLGPSEAAHIRSGYPEAGWRPTGMAEKPSDRRTAPLCRSCHREGPKAQHAANERSWWSSHGIYPPDLCKELKARFEETCK